MLVRPSKLSTVSKSCEMDLLRLLHGFVKVVTCNCQNWYMYFSPYSNKTSLKFEQDFDAR